MTDPPTTTQAGARSADPPEQARKMDRMYRYTRHVYDVTRRYYLLGRDKLLRRMVVNEGETVLEMGCGTARNLIKLGARAKGHALYGLDAAQVMLDTAAAALRKRGLADRVTLRQCLAEQLDHRATFGLDEPFDVIFFSYSLSMMPTWPQAIDAALANLAPDGRLYIVDFCDLGGYPRFVAGALKWWLSRFGVHHRPELIDHLHALEAEGRCALQVEYLYRRYAFLAELNRVAETV